MSDSTKLEAIRRLSLFEPDVKDNSGTQFIDYVVLDILSINGPTINISCSDVVKMIKDTHYVEFDNAEILRSAKRLWINRKIDLMEGATLSDESYLKIRQEAYVTRVSDLQFIKELESEVFKTWKDELSTKYSMYATVVTNLDNIVGTLQQFLAKIVFRHGIESVSILFPRDEKSITWLSSIQDEILKDLLKYDDITNYVIQIELPLFFQSSSPNRIEYLNSFFNSSFYWYLFQIDDKLTEYFKKVNKSQFLVLDNNIIQSIIGLHGHLAFRSVHNMLIYAKKLDNIIIVTTKTIDEVYQSLSRKGSELLKKTPLTNALARVAVDVLNSASFVVSYWEEFIKKGLTLEEFIVEKSHLNNILDQLGIGIVSDYREEIEGSEALIKEQGILTNACGVNMHPAIVEHDSFHNLFIQKLRGQEKYHYSEAIAWFISHDRKLPIYAKASLGFKASLPFCILSNVWIQINRPFLTRTTGNEFEDSFVKLVTQPYLRSISRSFNINSLRERLINRLARFDDVSYELAIKMATDLRFINETSKITKDLEFDERIKEKVIEINNDLVESKGTLQKSLTISKKVNYEYKSEIDKLNEELAAVKKDTLKQAESLNNVVYNLNSISSEKENQELLNQKLSSDLEKSKKIIRFLIYLLVLIIIIICIWLPLPKMEIIENNSHTNFIKIALTAFSSVLCALFFFEKYRPYFITGSIALFVATLLLIAYGHK